MVKRMAAPGLISRGDTSSNKKGLSLPCPSPSPGFPKLPARLPKQCFHVSPSLSLFDGDIHPAKGFFPPPPCCHESSSQMEAYLGFQLLGYEANGSPKSLLLEAQQLGLSRCLQDPAQLRHQQRLQARLVQAPGKALGWLCVPKQTRCMCIYKYIYIYIYSICIYTYSFIHICVYVCLHTYMLLFYWEGGSYQPSRQEAHHQRHFLQPVLQVWGSWCSDSAACGRPRPPRG